MKQKAMYSVYRGDNLVCIGTAKECADIMNISLTSFNWYKTPTGQARNGNRKNVSKRITIERLEEGDDE